MRRASSDAGFASIENLKALKAHGISDVMFHRRVGIEISDMVKSSWRYKKLRNFRTGIEGIISFLKRALGADRSRWEGPSLVQVPCSQRGRICESSDSLATHAQG